MDILYTPPYRRQCYRIARTPIFYYTDAHNISIYRQESPLINVYALVRVCVCCRPSRFYLVIFITREPRGGDRLREKLHKHRKPPISRTLRAMHFLSKPFKSYGGSVRPSDRRTMYIIIRDVKTIQYTT